MRIRFHRGLDLSVRCVCEYVLEESLGNNTARGHILAASIALFVVALLLGAIIGSIASNIVDTSHSDPVVEGSAKQLLELDVYN